MESVTWGPQPFWGQQGSFVSAVPIPIPGPLDQPLRCCHVNQTWLHYVVGCLDQLRQPTTWATDDPAALTGVMRAVEDLIVAVATADRCAEMGSAMVTISVGDSSGTTAITFPDAFDAAPVVVVSSDNADLIASTASVTASGFTAVITANVSLPAGGSATVSYVAGPAS